MFRLLIGVLLGGWAVWRWRSQLERYLRELPGLREKTVDAVDRGAAQVKKTLQSAGDAIRSSSRSSIDFSERAGERRDQ
jgi:hypothetical protein